jgi:hypothetical protein
METGFVAGTLVHTKSGLKPIEEICVGDWVLSHPEGDVPPSRLREGHDYSYRQVTKTYVHDDQPIVHVTYLQATGDGIIEILRVTPNHPIYIKR